LSRAAHLIATLFYVGHLPRAPGTWGTLAALPPGALILLWGGPWMLGLAVLVVAALGVWALAAYERASGRHDPPEGVVDECAGLWLALIPAAPQAPDLILAFVLFRVLDIVKPWPCRQIDRTRIAGWSGMLDDLVAGVYAAGLVVLLKRFTDAWFVAAVGS